MPSLRLHRVFRFNSFHELQLAQEPVHGHHFALEIGLKVDRDISELSTQMNAYWEQNLKPQLHHQNLSQMLFPATGENILGWIFKELQESEFRDLLSVLALQETKKNRFEIDMDQSVINK